jgi:hypothetical protein
MNVKMPSLAGSLRAIGGAIVLLVAAFLGGVVSRFFDSGDGGIDYTDYISIMLTSISVLLTALAIFLAVLGFIGWKSIADRVHQSVSDYLQEGFKKDGPLYLQMREQAQAVPYDGVSDFSEGRASATNATEGNDDEG